MTKEEQQPSLSSPTEQKVHELLNEFIHLVGRYDRAYKDIRPDMTVEEERNIILTRMNEIERTLAKAIENGGFEK
jgi:hypothetical protein